MVHRSNAATFPGPNSSSVSRKECFVVDITVILSFGPINKDFVLTSSFVLVDLIRKKGRLSLLQAKFVP